MEIQSKSNIMQIFDYSLEELDAAIPEIWTHIQKAKVVALVGDLGAGKTTFVAHLCKYLQVTDEVSSPTFALYNEYIVVNHPPIERIIHADLYRIEEIEELLEIGFEEMLEDSKTLFFIEWPQISETLLPEDTLRLQITIAEDGKRQMRVQSYFQ